MHLMSNFQTYTITQSPINLIEKKANIVLSNNKIVFTMLSLCKKKRITDQSDF